MQKLSSSKILLYTVRHVYVSPEYCRTICVLFRSTLHTIVLLHVLYIFRYQNIHFAMHVPAHAEV